MRLEYTPRPLNVFGESELKEYIRDVQPARTDITTWQKVKMKIFSDERVLLMSDDQRRELLDVRLNQVTREIDRYEVSSLGDNSEMAIDSALVILHLQNVIMMKINDEEQLIVESSDQTKYHGVLVRLINLITVFEEQKQKLEKRPQNASNADLEQEMSIERKPVDYGEKRAKDWAFDSQELQESLKTAMVDQMLNYEKEINLSNSASRVFETANSGSLKEINNCENASKGAPHEQTITTVDPIALSRTLTKNQEDILKTRRLNRESSRLQNVFKELEKEIEDLKRLSTVKKPNAEIEQIDVALMDLDKH